MDTDMLQILCAVAWPEARVASKRWPDSRGFTSWETTVEHPFFHLKIRQYDHAYQKADRVPPFTVQVEDMARIHTCDADTPQQAVEAVFGIFRRMREARVQALMAFDKVALGQAPQDTVENIARKKMWLKT